MEVNLYPRSINDKGGIACMPLKKNVPNGHSDWKLVKCPKCGRECWEIPLTEFVRQQGAVALCTECAIRAGMGIW